MGGSALAQVYSQLGDESPDVEDAAYFRAALEAVQRLVHEGLALAGHDVSDGGLIVTLLEMAFSGDCGIDVDVPPAPGASAIEALFAEEAGLVFEYAEDHEARVRAVFEAAGVGMSTIGQTTPGRSVKVAVNGAPSLVADMRELRAIWEETSWRLERIQANPECADEERRNIHARRAPAYHPSFTPSEPMQHAKRPKVAILREEGSNGDREMASAFAAAGFEPWDVTMTDIMEGRASLAGFRGAAFVGGFSYADVLDSAKGWAGAIRFNPRLREEFKAFRARTDTFSLGICNGCQLMALLGWVPWEGIAGQMQPRFVHNRSGRFESRFSTVRIEKSPSIMLQGMEGSVLGVWVAHGEGRMYFPDPALRERVLGEGLAPVLYTDDAGAPTEAYPFNPNGSPGGITALCSPDGRHLAMMPHPERAFRLWQWPWVPESWSALPASPWMRMFENARTWCEG
jgi:phosphoribosylformylglycinamidine synthase